MSFAPRFACSARAAVVALSVALVAGACGTGDADIDAASYEVADRVIAAVGESSVSVEPTQPNPECTTEVTEDEYGFETETITCPDGVEPTIAAPPIGLEPGEPLDPEAVLAIEQDLPPWVFDQLIAEVPDAQLGETFLVASGILARLDAACGIDFDQWKAALGELRDISTTLTEQATALAAAEAKAVIDAKAAGDTEPVGFVGGPLSRAVGRAFIQRSLTQTGCASPGSGAVMQYEALVSDGTLSLTSETALAVAQAEQAVSGSTWGDLFHFFSSQPNYQWLRTQQDPVDVAFLGTSQAGAAIDVVLVDQELSVRAGNAFLPGSLAEVQQHWIPELERYIDPPTVVWLMGGLDFLINCGFANRDRQFTDLLEQRSQTFTAAGWLLAIDPLAIILGPVGEQDENRGNGIKREPGPDIDALAGHSRDYDKPLAEPSFCEERAAVTAASIQRMVAEGRRLVVVGMPMNPVVTDLLAGGAPVIADAMARLDTDYLSPAGAEFIDLTAAMQDEPDLWADYTHVTGPGSVIFTELMANGLRDLGVGS